jgi:CheY-like chemotaxis protein
MDAQYPTSRRLNALVAESDSRGRRELVAAVTAMGLNAFEASYGSEAVDILAALDIHALIIDAELPDFGGLEAVRIVRTFRRVPPYVLLADEVTRALQAEAMESEAVSILRNPVDLVLLSEILESALFRWYGGRGLFGRL